jgi:hypothetical protein
MTWGAINELTTLTGYRRLVAVARHPVLTELLERIMLEWCPVNCTRTYGREILEKKRALMPPGCPLLVSPASAATR